MDKLRAQYVEYCVAAAVGKDTITGYMAGMAEDGTWPDIDYKDQNRSAWKTRLHVYRLSAMASAYSNPRHELFHDTRLKDSILKGLSHWLEKDYTNPNWWNNDIGVPIPMADTLILMGEGIPKGMIDRAMSTSLARAKISMTGQNLVWLAGISYVRGLIKGDAEEVRKARDVIFSELRVATQEGIQPDWSFHQHGPQQQFGNYGGAFGASITQWAYVMRGTSFALDEKQLAIIRNYLLEGPSWIVWNGKMDISGCGRQLVHYAQSSKGSSILAQIRKLELSDPENSPLYQGRVDSCEQGGKNSLIGNKHFWRSDMMVHRRPEWYASVKMSSPRVIGAETCNSENMLGLHLGDGAMYVYISGNEYQNIFPLWNWHRLPGTTTDQSIENLVPSRKKCNLPSEFAGGVSDGEYGIAALAYDRGVKAEKSWFFLGDSVICLGAGISSQSNGQITTSIQQSFASKVFSNKSAEEIKDKVMLKSGDWAFNKGIGYYLIDADNVVAEVEQLNGNWNKVHTTRANEPVSGNVFSIYINHGKSPQDAKYAYAVFPGIQQDKIAEAFAESGMNILSNTPNLQAISTENGRRVYAVFYKSGKLDVGQDILVESDTPCMVIVNILEKSTDIFVCDPTQKKSELTLKINGEEIKFLLKDGGSAGVTEKLSLIK